MSRGTELMSVGWLVLLRELLTYGPLSPGEFCPPRGWYVQTVASNLRRMEDAGLVCRRDDGFYEVTKAGEAIFPRRPEASRV